MLDLNVVEQFPKCSHTSLGGAALDPRGDRRRSHLIAAGNAHVVPRQRLQPGDFGVERRRCDVDQPGHRHLSFSLTHLFHLKKRASIFRFPFSWEVQRTAWFWADLYPNLAFCERGETIVSRAPAQHQLIGLRLRHDDIRHGVWGDWKTS